MELTREKIEFLKDSVPGCTAIYCLDGSELRTLYASPELPALNGMTPEQYRALTEKNAAMVVVPDDLPGLMAAVRECVGTGKPLDQYYRAIHSKLGFDWVHARARVCGELDGKPVLLAVYANASVETDIYRNILDRTRSMVYVCDCRTYEVLYANRAAREYGSRGGGENGSFLGKTCYSCIRSESKPCADCFLNEIRRGEFLSRVRYNSGRGTWEHISGEYVSWCGHDAFVQYVDDITESEKLRRDLEKAHRRYELAVESAGLGVWEYDIKRHRITSPSHSFKKFGIGDAVENVPESIMPMFAPEEQRKLADMYRRIEAGEPMVACELWMTWKPGEPQQCERVTYSVVRDETGAPSVAYGIGMNVTAQKQEQAKFHASMQAVLSANPEALCTYQLNLTRNQCGEGHGKSPFIVKKLRADTADGFFDGVTSLIPDGGDKEEFLRRFSRRALLKAFSEGESSRQIDYRRMDEEGRPFRVRSYVSMLKNPDTGDVQCVIYSLDITKEKQLSDIIRIITSRKYELIALLHTDTGRFETVRQGASLPEACRNVFPKPGSSCSYEWLRNRAASEWVAAEDRAKYMESSSAASVRRGLDESGRADYTVRELIPGCAGVTYRDIQHYYLDEDKRDVLIIESDVTETYRLQEKELELAKAAAERANDIMNSITSGICVLHMTDPDHLAVDFVNQQMFRILGFPPMNGAVGSADITNGIVAGYARDAFAGVHPEDIGRVRKTFRDNYGSRYFSVDNYRTMGAGGKYYWIKEEVRLRETTDRYRVFYATFRDVGEEVRLHRELARQLEEEKTLSRRAMAANKAKTEFLSRMSHDIRTPLNGIIGMTYIAGEQQNPPRTADCLAKIDTSSKFLLGLVNDVLDMSKAESDKIELHPEPYPADVFYAYLDAVIRPLCLEKNITLAVDAKPVTDAVPLMDRLRVNQVFFNLLSNAVKYTPEGGTVRFSMSERKTGEGRLMLEAVVSDNGVGISEEFQQILFEPFTQERRSDVSETRGTGLGLAIVKKMLDLMGGTVEVKSRIGEGTAFTVRAVFDCVPAERAGTDKAEDGGDFGELAGRHVLLCEDHPLNQEIAAALLAEKRVMVTVTEDGKQGVRQFGMSPIGFYDAVLMDIRMPVMDGIEATRRIRALPRDDAAGVPIIAMTADAFADDVEKCRAAGMDAHIAKPIDPAVLYGTLAGFFRRAG